MAYTLDLGPRMKEIAAPPMAAQMSIGARRLAVAWLLTAALTALALAPAALAAPVAPTITDSDPDSPGNDTTPVIKGTTQEAGTVTLYDNGDCSGFPFATGTAAEFADPGFTVAVFANSTTAFTATLTDLASETSACSASFTYVEDSTAPDAPTITDTDPDSPANDNDPEVKGTTGAGSPTHVRVYESTDCTGGFTEGTVAAFTGTGITVNVAGDATTPLSATAVDAAGNASTCSSSVNYTEDSIPPNSPTINDTDPDSPANDNDPEVKGTVAAGTSSLRIYKQAGCNGAIAATGTAAEFTGAGISVNVADDSTTQLSATALDAAGNISSCSTSFTYIEQSTAPGTPTITDSDPDSPANDNNPEIKGTADANSTVRLYTTVGCTGSPAWTGTSAQFASPGITVSVGEDQGIRLRATATNAAGTSGCSAHFDYLEDSTSFSPTVDDVDPTRRPATTTRRSRGPPSSRT